MDKDTKKDKIPLQEMKGDAYDEQLFSSSAMETERSRKGSCNKCKCTVIPKRYIISFLALLGFFNVYALRVNLSVALVAMVSNSTVIKEGKMIEVIKVLFFVTICVLLVSYQSSRRVMLYNSLIFQPHHGH